MPLLLRTRRQALAYAVKSHSPIRGLTTDESQSRNAGEICGSEGDGKGDETGALDP